MIVFGPVPSRRLGRSLGINNIPRKVCTYDCVYCQVGTTKFLTVNRRMFFSVEYVFEKVKRKVEISDFDYITFVSDGEPTLDVNLGKKIEKLKSLGKVAVITNGSLLYRDDVKEDLSKADLVSIKVDSVIEGVWKKINRSHESLKLGEILKGIKDFSECYNGDLITETMLVKGINDSVENLEATAKFISKVNPKISYISIPIRPPSQNDVFPPSPEVLDKAFIVFSSEALNVKLLSKHEVGIFQIDPESKDDLLSILNVHPIRKDIFLKQFKDSDKIWVTIQDLIKEGEIEEVEYKGVIFYRRK